jgi:hypothetical protein
MQFGPLKISGIVGYNSSGTAGYSQLQQMMIKFVWEIRLLGIIDLDIDGSS